MNWLRANRVCASVGCGLLALCAVGSVRGEGLESLRACADNAAATQIGLDALETACPRLGATLSQIGVAQWLEHGWQARLDRKQLADLASLVERYQGTAPQRPIDAASLPDILKTLRQAEPPPPNSVWEAFKAWVSDWLSRLDSRLGSWVERLLGRVGAAVSVVNVLLYGLIGLVLIAAAAVVVNELLAAGVLRRSAVRSPGRAVAPAAMESAVPSLAIDALPIYERPAQLLRLLVRRLVESGRLDRERALTHDELVARGVFDDAEQRAAFRAVASVAARILYGAQRPPPSMVEPALAEGRALLESVAVLPDAPQ